RHPDQPATDFVGGGGSTDPPAVATNALVLGEADDRRLAGPDLVEVAVPRSEDFAQSGVVGSMRQHRSSRILPAAVTLLPSGSNCSVLVGAALVFQRVAQSHRI